jgi:hypothetical protein
MRDWRRYLVVGSTVVLAWSGVAVAAVDPTMTSTSYSVLESEIGGNGCNPVTGNFCGASSNYSFNPGTDDGGSTLGEAAAGTSSSTSYQSGAGYNTTAQPYLSMAVNTGSVPLGTLSTSLASTGTATFDVIDYTSYGYTVQIIGTPPKYGTHTLANLATDTASSVGTEQFGVNLVSNSSPVSFGSNPYYPIDNVTYPGTSTWSYGVAGNGGGGYGTTSAYTIGGKFRFNSGDVVASSPKTSGDTRFTVSFLANIASTTNAGAYQASLAIVATGKY